MRSIADGERGQDRLTKREPECIAGANRIFLAIPPVFDDFKRTGKPNLLDLARYCAYAVIIAFASYLRPEKLLEITALTPVMRWNKGSGADDCRHFFSFRRHPGRTLPGDNAMNVGPAIALPELSHTSNRVEFIGCEWPKWIQNQNTIDPTFFPRLAARQRQNVNVPMIQPLTPVFRFSTEHR